jgi:gas vesicle protein
MAMGWKGMRRLLDREELLRRVGLETHTPTSDFFTGLGLFSVGVLVGAGLGLLFAPKRGEDMRAMMTEAWRNRVGRGAPEYRTMGGEASVQASSTEH